TVFRYTAHTEISDIMIALTSLIILYKTSTHHRNIHSFPTRRSSDLITSIILIKLIRVSLGTVRHPRRFKIVVIDIQITLKQMLRDFIGIRVNRAKKSGMVNITSSVNSRERSGINTILHELNPLF